MSTHLPASLSYMCSCDEAGAQEVPDPICPQSKRLTSLSPTRTAISFPEITSSGLVFIEFIPGMTFIPLMSPGEGLADGIGMFMSFGGDGAGVTEGAGICLPGMSFMGLGEGEAFGVGDGFAFCGAGIFMPGIS